jgi:predicted DCC family thiol-disulfide oxidoreductase YuxK
MDTAVVLFDGVCNLCTWSVQFILRRDPRAYFQFAALQSAGGQRLLQQHGAASLSLASVVLVEQGRLYTRSDAALRIARRLSGWWPLLSLLLVVPRPLRDAFYDWVAAHRYGWFGQADSCMIPTPATRRRFLDEPGDDEF